MFWDVIFPQKSLGPRVTKEQEVYSQTSGSRPRLSGLSHPFFSRDQLMFDQCPNEKMGIIYYLLLDYPRQMNVIES